VSAQDGSAIRKTWARRSFSWRRPQLDAMPRPPCRARAGAVRARRSVAGIVEIRLRSRGRPQALADCEERLTPSSAGAQARRPLEGLSRSVRRCSPSRPAREPARAADALWLSAPSRGARARRGGQATSVRQVQPPNFLQGHLRAGKLAMKGACSTAGDPAAALAPPGGRRRALLHRNSATPGPLARVASAAKPPAVARDSPRARRVGRLRLLRARRSRRRGRGRSPKSSPMIKDVLPPAGALHHPLCPGRRLRRRPPGGREGGAKGAHQLAGLRARAGRAGAPNTGMRNEGLGTRYKCKKMRTLHRLQDLCCLRRESRRVWSGFG